ncbi:MAG: hypothetical protein R3B06_15140 [Kofleriaceae bacterium]
MSTLRELADRAPDCLMAAWIDARTGDVAAVHPSDAGARYQDALATSIEIIRSPQRPGRTVMLSADLVYVLQRTASDSSRVLFLLSRRTANLGVVVALVRGLAEAA